MIGSVLALELLLLLITLVPVMGAAGAGAAAPAAAAAAAAAAGTDAGDRQDVSVLWWSVTVSQPTLFLPIVLLSGALGGVLHGLASLTDHVAKRDFDLHWIMWYLAHPFVGAAVATVFVMVLQAGLGGQFTSGAPGNAYGAGALAALSGMFSRHALKTLRDVFDAVTGNRAPPAALDVPRILRLFPTRLTAGAADARLVIVGTGFAPDSTVQVADARLPGEASDDAVTVLVPAGLIEQPGALEVRVRSGCAWSNWAELEVVP
jgi:hypothetical protein